jgi:tRNA nucleotidyltransferase (CCA-adding enzyme)
MQPTLGRDMQKIHLWSEELLALHKCFQAEGKDIRLVGGCVRDSLLGIKPHDIDLCTDATPDEQIAIYIKHNIRYVIPREASFRHGTLSILYGGDYYEITSLRQDVICKGRHSEVKFTTDWEADLGRRDFTCNAMMLTHQGELIDPFRGVLDLKVKRVVFVGDARARIKEDFLRILRYIRFHARLSGKAPFDPEIWDLLLQQADGLSHVSRERVWGEIKKILRGPFGVSMLKRLLYSSLAAPLDMKRHAKSEVKIQDVRDITKWQTVTLLILAIGKGAAVDLIKRWKFSRTEANLCTYLCNSSKDADPFTEIYLKRQSRSSVTQLLLLHGRNEQEAQLPQFPVTGDDLLALNYPSGPVMANVLTKLMRIWRDSEYRLSKENLLQLI